MSRDCVSAVEVSLIVSFFFSCKKFMRNNKKRWNCIWWRRMLCHLPKINKWNSSYSSYAFGVIRSIYTESRTRCSESIVFFSMDTLVCLFCASKTRCAMLFTRNPKDWNKVMREKGKKLLMWKWWRKLHSQLYNSIESLLLYSRLPSNMNTFPTVTFFVEIVILWLHVIQKSGEGVRNEEISTEN